jgi:hypothetical protein
MYCAEFVGFPVTVLRDIQNIRLLLQRQTKKLDQ